MRSVCAILPRASVATRAPVAAAQAITDGQVQFAGQPVGLGQQLHAGHPQVHIEDLEQPPLHGHLARKRLGDVGLAEGDDTRAAEAGTGRKGCCRTRRDRKTHKVHHATHSMEALRLTLGKAGAILLTGQSVIYVSHPIAPTP